MTASKIPVALTEGAIMGEVKMANLVVGGNRLLSARKMGRVTMISPMLSSLMMMMS